MNCSVKSEKTANIPSFYAKSSVFFSKMSDLWRFFMVFTTHPVVLAYYWLLKNVRAASANITFLIRKKIGMPIKPSKVDPTRFSGALRTLPPGLLKCAVETAKQGRSFYDINVTENYLMGINLNDAFRWAETDEGDQFWGDIFYEGIYDGRFETKLIKRL